MVMFLVSPTTPAIWYSVFPLPHLKTVPAAGWPSRYRSTKFLLTITTFGPALSAGVKARPASSRMPIASKNPGDTAFE